MLLKRINEMKHEVLRSFCIKKLETLIWYLRRRGRRGNLCYVKSYRVMGYGGVRDVRTCVRAHARAHTHTHTHTHTHALSQGVSTPEAEILI